METDENTKSCYESFKSFVAAQNERLMKIEDLLSKSIDMNSLLIKSADSRLDRANEMVLLLAKSVSALKDICDDLEKKYTGHIEKVCINRDLMIKENIEMRKELSDLRHDMFETLKDLARKPSISNSNRSELVPN